MRTVCKMPKFEAWIPGPKTKRGGRRIKKHVEISDIGGSKVDVVINNAEHFIEAFIRTTRTEDVKEIWKVELFCFL